MSAFNLGAILFQLINRAFPDPAMGQYQMSTSGEAIWWAVAGLVVAFPLFSSQAMTRSGVPRGLTIPAPCASIASR
jgi:hypothetical protein